ncbi:MAG: endonuclease/exonuclease/phosphatase family protein [Mycobacteriales bacterium]
MRVVTFNVLHGRSLQDGRVDPVRLGEEIASLGADVLGMQEVDRAQPRSGGVDIAAVAAAAMGAGTQCRFVPAVIGTPGEDWTAAVDADDERSDTRAYGIALATRLPVRSWHILRLRAAPMRSVVADPGARRRVILIQDEPRVLLAAVVDGPAGPMTVATTHLSFVPGWNVWQVRRVCRELRRLPAPRLLLGDLNLPGRLAGVVSGWRMLARAATYPAADPRVQLDHVLADGPTPAVLSTAVRTLRVSDHCALVVDLADAPA